MLNLSTTNWSGDLLILLNLLCTCLFHLVSSVFVKQILNNGHYTIMYCVMQMLTSATRRHVPQETRALTSQVALHADICQLKQEQTIQVSGFALHYVQYLCNISFKGFSQFQSEDPYCKRSSHGAGRSSKMNCKFWLLESELHVYLICVLYPCIKKELHVLLCEVMFSSPQKFRNKYAILTVCKIY